MPAPAWTRRPRAKDDLRETAVAMRREGRSYREIREVVGVSKGTLSLWLRDVPLTDDQQRELDQRTPEAASRRAQVIRAGAAQRRARIQAEARDQIQFGTTQLKRHNPKTVRRNVGEDYHGCLIVYVRRSADLTLRIAGWCEGLTALCGR